MILLIETATAVCSVALSHQGKVLGEMHSNEPNAHSSRLATLCVDILNENRLHFNQLDAVCVSSGPGSYTGLRIGISTAKGYCYALNKPLLAVPTLMSIAYSVIEQQQNFDGIICPMIDARRMECYTALYRRGHESIETLRDADAEIINSESYADLLQDTPIVFVGDGAEKTKSLLGQNANARYIDNWRISAASMAKEAERRLKNGQTEDVAYFEPFYLKDFVAKKSVVRGLR